MIGRRIAQRLRQHGWFAVAVDLVVVIVGILLALQLDGWAEDRQERRLEQVYLRRLSEDLRIERSRMAAAANFANARIDAARLLARLADDPSLASSDPSRLPWALETATWRSFPQINAFVYRELQGTGRFVLIRSEALRNALTEHYTELQHDSRVGEDLSAQFRFDAAVAGLLSIEELEFLERYAGDCRQLNTTPERALALARAFARRAPAVAELPGLVQHHTYNLRVIAQMQERAVALIEQIDSLTSSSRADDREPATRRPDVAKPGCRSCCQAAPGGVPPP